MFSFMQECGGAPQAQQVVDGTGSASEDRDEMEEPEDEVHYGQAQPTSAFNASLTADR
jgi:hypothetical protein